MGARGPQPTPTATLKARGSWRAKLREGEVQFPPGKPAAPAHLGHEAKKEWRRVVRMLLEQGVYQETDRALLCVYCEAWAEWVLASEKVAETGPLVKTEGGGVVINPLMRVRDAAAARVVAMAAHFGFSPAARTRVRAGPRPDDARQADEGPKKLRFFQQEDRPDEEG